jgi:hypothetical protein
MKWSIAQKLTASCGMIFLTVSIFSIYTINIQSEYESDILVYKNINDQVFLSNEIRYRIGNVGQYLTDASLTNGDAILNEAEKNLTEAIQHIL